MKGEDQPTITPLTALASFKEFNQRSKAHSFKQKKSLSGTKRKRKETVLLYNIAPANILNHSLT